MVRPEDVLSGESTAGGAFRGFRAGFEMDTSSEASWEVSREPLTCLAVCAPASCCSSRGRDLNSFQGQAGRPEAVCCLHATLQFPLLRHQRHLQRGRPSVPAGVCACVRACKNECSVSNIQTNPVCPVKTFCCVAPLPVVSTRRPLFAVRGSSQSPWRTETSS